MSRELLSVREAPIVSNRDDLLDELVKSCISICSSHAEQFAM